ncbi:MAG: alpha/beta hydrolase [Deltaproteobacteria bacterium]|nr:alpha/beta hydrolase [Deltaproteobacteria bacterium]
MTELRSEFRDGTFEIDGTWVHYLEAGDPEQETFVFVHGNRDHCHTWDFLLESFDKAGFSLPHMVALDLRGHGDSGWVGQERGYRHEDFVLDVVGLLRHLNKDRVTLVAHSLGGSMAVVFAGALPERIKRLVIIESAGPYGRTERETPELFGRWTRDDGSDTILTYYATAAQAADAVCRRFPLIPNRVAMHMARHGTRRTPNGLVWKYDPRARNPSYSSLSEAQVQAFIERIDCPTLLVFGADSGYRESPRYNRIAHFPNKTLVEIPGAGHHVQHEKPDELAAVLIPFLNNHG